MHTANSSPKMFAPSAPLRLDNLSLAEQHELKGAAWFQAGIPREISLEVLSRQSPGAFLVRQSSTKPGCFALSLRVPPPAPKVAHYLILRTPRGYKIKVSYMPTEFDTVWKKVKWLKGSSQFFHMLLQGFTKEFSSLRALITHHSVMPELLPVPLTLPRPTNMGAGAPGSRHGSRGSELDGCDDFDTYGSLNDFRKMMADLNVWLLSETMGEELGLRASNKRGNATAATTTATPTSWQRIGCLRRWWCGRGWWMNVSGNKLNNNNTIVKCTKRKEKHK